MFANSGPCQMAAHFNGFVPKDVLKCLEGRIKILEQRNKETQFAAKEANDAKSIAMTQVCLPVIAQFSMQ